MHLVSINGQHAFGAVLIGCVLAYGYLPHPLLRRGRRPTSQLLPRLAT